jgi:hypothetical protein
MGATGVLGHCRETTPCSEGQGEEGGSFPGPGDLLAPVAPTGRRWSVGSVRAEAQCCPLATVPPTVPRAAGKQLQHLPETPGLPHRGGVHARRVQLLHQGFGLLDGQLAGPALQPLQVGQQGGEVLVRNLSGERSVRAGQGAWAQGPSSTQVRCPLRPQETVFPWPCGAIQPTASSHQDLQQSCVQRALRSPLSCSAEDKRPGFGRVGPACRLTPPLLQT